MNAQDSQTNDESSQIDFIGAAIKEMRVQTASASSISRHGDWTFSHYESESPVGYFILRGQAEVVFQEQKSELLEVGDLLIVTKSKSHRLQGLNRPQLSQTDDSEPSSTTSFLFANIQAQIAIDCPFASALPDYFLFRSGERAASPYFEAQLQCLAWEAKSSEAASELMQARLWEIIFMQAFRAHLAKTKIKQGWLAAICDEQLSKVLAVIHRFPERDWTVEKLAAEGAMSRASLARRFAATMHETPMGYLFKQRMRIAANLLRDPGASIPLVAQRVGYASESSFSSAFHRRFNLWPGEYRLRESSQP